MSRPYQTTFDNNQSPLNRQQQGHFSNPASPASAGGQPTSFKTNVNRAKTKRWVEAKSYSYDGDDWGDADDYDEYGAYDEPPPPPPPKPTGLRQKGQVASSPLNAAGGGFGVPGVPQPGKFFQDDRKGYGDLSRPPQSPSQQYRERAPIDHVPMSAPGHDRSNSFDEGDEKRAFSAGGYQTSSASQSTRPDPTVFSSSDQDRRGPPTRFSQMGIASSIPVLSSSEDNTPVPLLPQGSQVYPHPSRQSGQGPPALHVQTQSPGVHDAPKAERPTSPSSANYRGVSYSQLPRRMSSASRTLSIDSNTPSDDFQHRRDFSPSAVPPPLHARGSPSPNVDESSMSGPFPPRKSSMSQQTSPYIPKANSASHESPRLENMPSKARPSEYAPSPTRDRAASNSSNPSKSLPFIRPADIYKRMEEERERERQSLDSGRPSLDSVSRANELDSASGTGAQRDGESSGSPAKSGRRRPSQESVNETDGSRRLKPMLDPVNERRSEYGFDGFSVGDLHAAQNDAIRSNNPQQPSLIQGDPTFMDMGQSEHTGDRITNDEDFRSPSLPRVNRVSGFGNSIWSTPQTDNENQISSEERFATAPFSTANQDHLLPQTDYNTLLQHQPSLGFNSVVHQAFDPSVPPTPSSTGGSQRSRDGTGVNRTDSHSTAGVSPIMSRVPSAATATAKAREAELRNSDTPAIAEEAHDPVHPSSRPTSASNTMDPPLRIPRRPSPSHTPRSSRDSTPHAFKAGHRRNLSTPSPGNSPARSPALETTTQLPAAQEVELANATPVGPKIPTVDLGPSLPAPFSQGGETSNDTDYTSREADLACAVNANPDIEHSSTSTAVDNARDYFLDSRGVPLGAIRDSTTSIRTSRSESPNKGKVRHLADKFESNSSPTRSSPQSTLSKASRSFAEYNQQLIPQRPAADRAETFRPALPGGWTSYATTAETGTPGSSGRTLDQVEPSDEQIYDDRPTTPHSFPNTAIEDIDITPTTTKRNLEEPEQVNHSTSAFAAAAAAGVAMAEAFTAAIGIDSHSTPENSESESESSSTKPEQTTEAGTEHGEFPDKSIHDWIPDNAESSQRSRIEDTSSSASSVAPTPPPKDTPMQYPQSEADYFPPTVPLKHRALDQLSPLEQRSYPARPQMLPFLSTDTAPQDQESDRLRKEIVRSLSPRTTRTEAGDVPTSDVQPSEARAANNYGPNHQTRESTVLPSEHDSYWETTREDPGLDSDGTMPNIDEEPSHTGSRQHMGLALNPSSGSYPRNEVTENHRSPLQGTQGPAKTVFDPRPQLPQHQYSWEDEDLTPTEPQESPTLYSTTQRQDFEPMATMGRSRTSQEPNAFTPMSNTDYEHSTTTRHSECNEPHGNREDYSRHNTDGTTRGFNLRQTAEHDQPRMVEPDTASPMDGLMPVEHENLSQYTGETSMSDRQIESGLELDEGDRQGERRRSEWEHGALMAGLTAAGGGALTAEHHDSLETKHFDDESAQRFSGSSNEKTYARDSGSDKRSSFDFNQLTSALRQEHPSAPSSGDGSATSIPSKLMTESHVSQPSQPTQARVPAFREILAMKSQAERIRAYNETREQLAKQESGLSQWIAFTASQNPDYPGPTSLPSRPVIGVPGLAGAQGLKQSPTSPTQAAQQPYYQQYLSAQSSATAGSAKPTSPTSAGGFQGSSTSGFGSGKLSSQQVQAKGKDLLHSAGKYSGKANIAAKGLFAKGKSRFRNASGGTGDKTTPSLGITVDPMSNPSTPPLAPRPGRIQDEDLNLSRSTSEEGYGEELTPETSIRGDYPAELGNGCMVVEPASVASNELYNGSDNQSVIKREHTFAPMGGLDEGSSNGTNHLRGTAVPVAKETEEEGESEVTNSQRRAVESEVGGYAQKTDGRTVSVEGRPGVGVEGISRTRIPEGSSTMEGESARIPSYADQGLTISEDTSKSQLVPAGAEASTPFLVDQPDMKADEPNKAHEPQLAKSSGHEPVLHNTLAPVAYTSNTAQVMQDPKFVHSTDLGTEALEPVSELLDRDVVEENPREEPVPQDMQGHRPDNVASEARPGEGFTLLEIAQQIDERETSPFETAHPARFPSPEPSIAEGPYQDTASRPESLNDISRTPTQDVDNTAIEHGGRRSLHRAPSPGVSPERERNEPTSNDDLYDGPTNSTFQQRSIRQRYPSGIPDQVQHRPFSFMPSPRGSVTPAPESVPNDLSSQIRPDSSLSQTAQRNQSGSFDRQQANQEPSSSSGLLRSRYSTAQDEIRHARDRRSLHQLQVSQVQQESIDDVNQSPEHDMPAQYYPAQLGKTEAFFPRQQSTEYEIAGVGPPSINTTNPKRRNSGFFRGLSTQSETPEKTTPEVPSTGRKDPAQWAVIGQRTVQRGLSSSNVPSPEAQDIKPKKSGLFGGRAKPLVSERMMNKERMITHRPGSRNDRLQRSDSSSQQWAEEGDTAHGRQSATAVPVDKDTKKQADQVKSRSKLQRSSTSGNAEQNEGKKKRFSGLGSLFSRSGTTGHSSKASKSSSPAPQNSPPLDIQSFPRGTEPLQLMTPRQPAYYTGTIAQAPPIDGYYAPQGPPQNAGHTSPPPGQYFTSQPAPAPRTRQSPPGPLYYAPQVPEEFRDPASLTQRHYAPPRTGNYPPQGRIPYNPQPSPQPSRYQEHPTYDRGSPAPRQPLIHTYGPNPLPRPHPGAQPSFSGPHSDMPPLPTSPQILTQEQFRQWRSRSVSGDRQETPWALSIPNEESDDYREYRERAESQTFDPRNAPSYQSAWPAQELAAARSRSVSSIMHTPRGSISQHQRQHHQHPPRETYPPSLTQSTDPQPQRHSSNYSWRLDSAPSNGDPAPPLPQKAASQSLTRYPPAIATAFGNPTTPTAVELRNSPASAVQAPTKWDWSSAQNQNQIQIHAQSLAALERGVGAERKNGASDGASGGAGREQGQGGEDEEIVMSSTAYPGQEWQPSGYMGGWEDY